MEFRRLLFRSPSGCGKSTLLNIVAGLDKSYTGNVLVKGQPVESTGPDRIVIFQEGALFPWLTVLENVEFGLKVAKISKDKRSATAFRYIDMEIGRAEWRERVGQDVLI